MVMKWLVVLFQTLHSGIAAIRKRSTRVAQPKTTMLKFSARPFSHPQPYDATFYKSFFIGTSNYECCPVLRRKSPVCQGEGKSAISFLVFSQLELFPGLEWPCHLWGIHSYRLSSKPCPVMKEKKKCTFARTRTWKWKTNLLEYESSSRGS